VKTKIECSEIRDNYGCFVVEPLERGVGTTLGNALRRVILTALPGAAVNQVKIEGAPHEFSTIPHMKEDVVDFLLNVKALRLCPLTHRAGKLSLEVEGKGCVCAADIIPSADFEIANPELHLATLDSDEARLCVEFQVELGTGYIPATQSDGLPIGTIPIDAIFTPIRKVNYKVEPAHIGQQTGYDRLILEIWTDGTISPPDAFIEGAQILGDRFSTLAAQMERTKGEGKEEPSRLPVELYELSIEQVGFTQSLIRRLKRNRITKLGELLGKSEKELLSLEKFGSKSLEELRQSLKERGLSLTGAPIEETSESIPSGTEEESNQ
jgi:DNA-directed RNA polymerase subunit alpha